jgi:AbrB family looped-hinge helix DNA binding protein
MPENDAPTKVRLDPQGRMVIPAKLRKLLEIEPGDTLLARFHEGQLVLEKAETIKRRLKKRFSRLPRGKSLAEELLAERRAEARRENDK